MLRRYPGLTSLAVFYLIYLVPAIAAIWHHSAAAGGDAELLGAAPVLSAGELARLFVSVTMMGDQAAELTQTAPVSARAIQAAKLAAASLGVLAILGVPVVGTEPQHPPPAVPAMLAGICGNVACNLLLGLWHPAPIRRTRSAPRPQGLGRPGQCRGFFFSATWSFATWQMLRGSPWALLPVVATIVALCLCAPAEMMRPRRTAPHQGGCTNRETDS